MAIGRLVHVLSWHQVQTDDELAAALRQIKGAGLILEDQVRLCVIGDGAPWIWKQVQTFFPSAVEILDYYHCWEHLHTMVAFQYGEHLEQQQEWYEADVGRLFWGEVHGVI